MSKDLFRIPNEKTGVPAHAERAVSLLSSQFANSPLFKGMLKAYSRQIQDLQKALEDMYDFRSLTLDPDFLAVGAQLDGIGEILNLPRDEGETDNHYRLRLRFKSFLIFSSGTPEQLMEILRVNSQATFVKYYDIFPAAYQMITDGGAEFQDNTDLNENEQINHNFISQMIFKSSPAAVQFVPVTATYGVDLVFGFSSDVLPFPLVVNMDSNINAPLLADPYLDKEYYVNTGYKQDSIEEGGFAELSSFAVLSLDDDGLLVLDDGSFLLLYDTDLNYDTIGAGQYAEMLFYTE